MAFCIPGCRVQKLTPSASCPVQTANKKATKTPPKLVHAMLSNMLVLGFFKWGFRRTVAVLTRSCNAAVMKSKNSEQTIKVKPYALDTSSSSAEGPFFGAPRLNTTTPAVTASTCTYCDLGYALPDAIPPTITGIDLQLLPKTCVGKDTNLNASFAAAMAAICETPDVAISKKGTFIFVAVDFDSPRVLSFDPHLTTSVPINPTSVLTPRSTIKTRNVALNRSPP